MPAATNKAELLDVTQREREKLAALIETVAAAEALAPDEEMTTIKEIIGHRAHWITLFLGWYADGAAGREVHLPAKGYKWNELKRYNADLRAKQAGLGWAEARRLLSTNQSKLEAFLAGLSEDELYGAPMAGGRNDWTTGRWAEAAGASHYRSAAKYIRARLKQIRVQMAR